VAKASAPPADTKNADKAGLLSGLLAEENEFDRRTLWRIGSWGFAAVGAVVLAVAANQSSFGWRRDQIAAADLSRQAQQIQSLAKESQNETRRLASAIDTLNNDRDRLFARVTVVEQGLDSVTGAINKQSAAASSASVASVPPKPMPPASAMPSMISPPPVVAADNAASTAPASPSQAAPPTTNAVAVAPEKPKEQVKGPAKEVAKELAKVELPKAEQPKAEQAKTGMTKTGMAKTELAKAEQAKPEQAKPAPAVADTASLPQIASNKPTASPLAASAPASAMASAAAAAQISPPAMAATKSMMGPPDPGAPRLIETSKEATKESTKTANAAPTPATASPPPASDANAAALPKDEEKPELDADAARDAEKSTIQRTEFAVELGGANSIGGLRALWRGLLKTHANRAALAELQPIIVLRESNTGLGMQLRLAAGPLHDAAEAAKICAALTAENKRTCETTVFDGQRLAMGKEEAQPTPEGKQPPTPAGGKSTSYKRYYRHSKKEEPPPPPPPQQSSTFSSLFGIKR